MTPLDMSALPPPSPQFMVAMAVFRQLCDECGRDSEVARFAMSFVLKYAPQEIKDKMARDAQAMGLIGPSMKFGPDGEPIYTAEDLAAFYCMDPADVAADEVAASLSLQPAGGLS